MRKRLLLLFAVLAMAINASAYDFCVDGIYYNYLSQDDLTCEVTYKDNNYNSYSGDIVIPSSVTYSEKTFSVTEIGDAAFKWCSSLPSVAIPNSVTSIGDAAFNYCSSLTSVEIPNSVTSIGESAFEDCSSLTSVEIPNSVTSIGAYAFRDCSSLTSVVIPNSVISIGAYAFDGCSSLTSVEIPNSVTSIGWSAFSNCSSLKSVEIPNSVTSIGSYAFSECSCLTSVEIPNSVTSIGNSAFSGCSGLTSLTIGKGVVSVGSNAFEYCSSLYKLILFPKTVPAGLSSALGSLSGRVTYVANDNYSGSVYGTIKKYDYLSSYFDVDGIRYVPISPSERTCAAINCTYSEKDKAIKMNSTVTFSGIEMKMMEVGNHLIRNNRYVESIEVSLPIDIPDCFAIGCSNTKSVMLNDNTSSIGSSAFQGCSSLASIVLPSSLTTIKSNAFANSGLTSIELPSSTTDIETGVFNGCKNLAKFTAKDGNEILKLGHNSSGKGLFYDCPLKDVEIGRIIGAGVNLRGYPPHHHRTTA